MTQRIQQSRAKGWRMPVNARSVARPSLWGNPFKVEDWGLDLSLALFGNTVQGIWNPSTLGQDKSDEQFDKAYKAHCDFTKRLGGHPTEIARYDLYGLDLACWCPLDQPCHADILLGLARTR